MMTALDLGLVLFVKPAGVLAVAGVLTVALRRSSAAARHIVWAAAVIATLALPLLGGVLPKLRLPVLPTAFGQRAGAALAAGPSGTSAWDVADRVGRSRLAAPPLHSLAGPVRWLPLGLTAVWLLGALALGSRRLVAMLRVRGIVARTTRVSDPRILSVFREATRACGARSVRTEIRTGDAIHTPATAGLFDPVILLPAEASRWTDAELSSVLAHELGHVGRRDGLVNLFTDLAACLYWCDPLVGLAVRRLKLESERACDDLALRSGARPRDYAALLLRVASAARTTPSIPEPALAIARPCQLETRLRALLDERIRREPPRRWVTALLVSVAAIAALPAAAVTFELAHVPAPWRAGPEPDTRDDALASSESERLGITAHASATLADTTLLFRGPDSTLARNLVAALGHEPANASDLVRDRAAWALAQARAGRLVEPLLGALEDQDWRVRAYAAWALAGAREPKAVPRLVELLSDPVWRMRAMAAFALRVSGDPRAEDAMRAALTDPAWQVRMEAVGYFATLAGPEMRGLLTPRLADRHVAVRHAAEAAFAP